MTWAILDMPEAESREILGFLFDHQERPEFVYEHAWRPGDVILWDNRSCLHARTDFDAAERRRLRRVTVIGETPYE
jgi:taurine dioxygenase